MKYWVLGAYLIALLSTSCAVAPYPQEQATLKQAIIGAAAALDGAADEIGKKGYNTFNLRPSKATVSFDMSTIRAEGNSAQISVGVPTVPVTGGLGWSATKQLQQGSHVVIEFEPKK